MAYQSLDEIAEYGKKHEEPFWRAVMLDDVNERTVTEQESVESMRDMWKAMLSASEEYDETLISNSGLVGGMGVELRTGIGNFVLEGRYYFGLSDFYGNSKSDPYSRSAHSYIGGRLTYLFDISR